MEQQAGHESHQGARMYRCSVLVSIRAIGGFLLLPSQSSDDPIAKWPDFLYNPRRHARPRLVR